MDLDRRELLLGCTGCAIAALTGCERERNWGFPDEDTDPSVAEEPPEDGYPCDVPTPDGTWTALDFPELFEVGVPVYTTLAGVRMAIVQSEPGCWVAIDRVCSHQGVLIEYREDRNEFVCPPPSGHGTIFNLRGEILAGPAPRDASVYNVAESEGVLYIDLA